MSENDDILLALQESVTALNSAAASMLLLPDQLTDAIEKAGEVPEKKMSGQDVLNAFSDSIDQSFSDPWVTTLENAFNPLLQLSQGMTRSLAQMG